MADVNANIGVNIETSEALAQLKSLQRQISQFHTSISKSSEAAALAQRSLQKNFLNSVNSIGAFSAELRNVKTSSESFTESLEKNKFSMREYFRYAGASTKTFGRLFTSEFDTIGKVAEERVKKLQTQYIKLGRDTSGAMKAIAVIPNELNMDDYGTKVQIAAQKQAIFNQLMKQGSTNLLNFGKNTQWAGRQLMVGFTLPLLSLGTAASKTFMDMEAQAIKFKKVYGDLFTPQEETQQALENITELGKQFTKYGVAVSTTVGLASEAAAAGFSGLDLQRQTTEATRLSILGQLESQKALETTISLQNAFGMSSENLASSIDFLNAVENQTVVSLDDITTAIPKVAPVIQQLGGDVKDLTFFLAAMKEGGINASEGANALKSGLASIINPTGRASEMLKSFGINATEIVTKNKGNLKATVIEFATALNQLDPLNRAQAIEQMFGKFQFARLSTLFANVAKDGNQAARVLDLANASVEELSALSEQELGMTADSAMNKFKKTVEDLKFALVPVGKTFLEAVTPIVEFVGNILEKFSNLSDGVKKAITIMTVVIGGLGPVLLMTFGLLANGVANIIKLFLTLRNGYQRLTGQSQVLGEQTQYLTSEQLDAAAAASSLNQRHATLTQTFNVERDAVDKLRVAYQQALSAAQKFAMANPGMMAPKPKKFATGGVVSGPGTGTSDSVPIMASKGEAVIPAKSVNKYPQMVAGLIAGNIPGYAQGTLNVGGRALSMNFRSPANVGQIQDIVSKLMDAGDAVSGAENILAETLFRVSKDTSVSLSSFTKELDTVAAAMENIQIPENIIGERDYSASGAGVKGNVRSQIESARGAIGVEEYERANVASQAVYEEYKKLGISGRKLEQALQVDRAHIVKVTHAEKRYAEAWDTRLFVAQSRAENEMSMLLVQDKNQKPYIDALKRIDASEDVKNSILYKITNDLGLTEEELQVQAKVLKEMQADASLMKQTTSAFPTIAAGTIASANARAQMGPASAGVGSRSTQEIEMARQQLLRAKFRGETQFVKQLEVDGTNAVDKLLVAMERKAETASPSKRTRRLGRNIVEGLRLGLKDGEASLTAESQKITDIAALSKSNLYGTAGPVDPVQKSIRRQLDKRQKMSDVVGGMSANKLLEQASKKNAEQMAVTSERLSRLNSGIMAGTFALTSLAGVTSMTSGALGNISQQVMKYSGLLFALMSVTQLLTQAKVVELAVTRAKTVADAMGSKTVSGLFSRGGGIVGLGKNLMAAAKFAVRFAGVLGLAVTALGATVTIIKLVNAAREREKLAVEGLGNAMTLTTEKVKILAGLLGQSPVPRAGAGARVSANQLNATEQSAVDELRQSEEFLKTYKKDILAIKSSTVAEAEIAFNAIALDLSGQGFTKEAIKTYIDALGEEANKTEVSLKFKQIDLSKEEGQTAAIDLAKDVVKGFNKAFEGKLLTIPAPDITSASATVTSKINLSKEQQKQLNVSSSALANTFAGLTGAFGRQTIKADEYNKKMAAIAKTIPTGTAGMLLMDKILLNISPKFAKASAGVTDYDAKMLLLRASLVNASVAETIFQDLISKNPAKVAAAKAELEKYRNATDALAKNVVIPDPFTDLDTTKEKSPFEKAVDQLKQQKKELLESTKAYSSLRSAGIGAGKAFEIAKDPILAAAVASTKVGTEKWKQLIKLIKETDAALIKSKITELTADTDYTKAFTSIVPVLKNLGLNAEEINNIFADPTFAQQFINNIKNGKVQVADLEKLINKTMQNRTAKLKFETSIKTDDEIFDDAMANANKMFDTVQAGIQAQYRDQITAGEDAVEKAQGKVSDIEKEIDAIQSTISDKQRDIEENITRKIEEFQTDIDKLQSEIKDKFDTPLAKLSDEGDILSNTLSLIDRQESSINAKYDAQAQALADISDINSEIVNQQKQQLGLADALSRGDIAAAAGAAQEMRSTAAQAAATNASQMIDAARKAEIQSVSVNGMTRAQIEERQFQISQQSFTLQQQRKVIEQDIANIEANQIAPLTAKRVAAELLIRNEEDKIYRIQKDRLIPAQEAVTKAEAALKATQDKLKADLAIIEQDKQYWIDAKTARDLAAIDQGKYKALLVETSGVAKGVLDKILALNTTVKTIHNIHTVYTSSGSSGTSGGAGRGGAQTKMYGGKILAMSTGGFVPGVGLTDKVPALLTPGEFVMNKAATKEYGSLLESINDKKYPSMSGFKSVSAPGYSSPKNNIVNYTPVNSNSAAFSDNSNTVYNYSVGITVGGNNSNPDSIAKLVLNEIKYIDSQRIRGQR